MSLVVNFAAIGFRPYWDVGEFVNVGVLVVEARSRYLGYRLVSPQRTRRISACFPEVDLSVFKNGIRRLDSELSALAIETNLWTDESKPVGNRQSGAKSTGKSHPAQSDLFVDDGDIDLFRRLTEKRASPFFFASQGTQLAEELDPCLDSLYRRYVEHWNLTPADHEEKKLARDLRRLLHAHRLDRLYRECPWVGTEAYHVGIPLAFTPRGKDLPEKAIKPLNLAQSTPTRIYTHGDEWIAKVRRLKSVDSLPEEFLFVVKFPADDDARAAAEEICDGLLQLGVSVAEVGDVDAILDFARIEEQPELKLEF